MFLPGQGVGGGGGLEPACQAGGSCLLLPSLSEAVHLVAAPCDHVPGQPLGDFWSGEIPTVLPACLLPEPCVSDSLSPLSSYSSLAAHQACGVVEGLGTSWLPVSDSWWEA